MAENKLIVTFDVSTSLDMNIGEATHELLMAEQMLNEKSKLRWYLTQVTLSDLKTFIDNLKPKQ